MNAYTDLAKPVVATDAVDALASSQAFADTAQLITAMRPDQPLFCFSAPALAARLKRFKGGFAGDVCFAVKAAPLPQIVNTLIAGGIDGFDVASPAEMALVRGLSADARLYYNNPVKSADEIAAAFRHYGVTHFTVDDVAELAKIARIVPAGPNVEIAVRFRLADHAYGTKAAYAFHTKFGALAAEAAALLRQADRLGFAVSLSFHPGSQCTDPASFAAHVAEAADIANRAGVTLKRLNVGGGFPAAYPGSPAPALETYFSTIAEAAAAHFPQGIKLIAEPGRALAAPAMSLLTRIKHRRPSGEIFLNDGLYGGLMELLMADIALPVRCWKADGTPLAGENKPAVVFGPTCDSIDRLPRQIDLACAAAEGDYVEFGLAGAYSAATVTRFNGYGALSLVAVDNILQA